VLWRAGLRISEALALAESDLDARRGAVLVRRGKGGRRREVGMDDWAWQELQPWLASRLELPVGPLFCVITGPTRDDGGPTPQRAARSATPRLSLESAGASRRISCATRTRSRWPTRAFR
jgi:integrase